MNRRKLLVVVAGIVTSAGLGGAWLWRRLRTSSQPSAATLREAIVRYYDYLDLDPAGVERFVHDYQTLLVKGGLHDPPLEETYAKYLLSTDFFQNGANESRKLHYVMLHDPFVSPCYNPFLRPD